MASAIDVSHELAGPDDGPVLVPTRWAARGAMWDLQVPTLAERLRVVYMTIRGHGGLPAPPGPYALADLGADALASPRSALALSACTGAASLGGDGRDVASINAPERVDRLVLCHPRRAWAAGDGARSRRDCARRGRRGYRRRRHRRWLTEGFIERELEKTAVRAGACGDA